MKKKVWLCVCIAAAILSAWALFSQTSGGDVFRESVAADFVQQVENAAQQAGEMFQPGYDWQSSETEEESSEGLGAGQTPDSGVLGTLEICGREFPVYNNVEAATLKKGLGWLHSALPPEQGTCIVMGHRNTQFRILQNLEIGDRIGFEISGSEYAYEVRQTDIFDSDADLRFYASDGCTLVLVTCYPFYYSGHAPKKFVVTAAMI